MNRTMLYAALFTVCCSAVNADDNVQPAAAQTNTATTAPVINCQYRIPANTPVKQPLLKVWAKHVALQSFNFSPTAIDEQLKKLKQCFTDPGWKGYKEALEKSGNISIIKTQNLNVSSQVDGEIKIN